MSSLKSVFSLKRTELLSFEMVVVSSHLDLKPLKYLGHNG